MKLQSSAKKKNYCINFQRDLLPDPLIYYRDEGLHFIGGGEWRSALCPFHEDRNPSLRVHLDSGAFKCMACDASGSDILKFHMQLYDLKFVEAAKALGAWEDSHE